MEVPGGDELLRVLFKQAPPGTVVELRRVPGGALDPLDPQNPALPPPTALNDGQWYFGACPRGQGGEVEWATSVWADFDGNAPAKVYPSTTAEVNSGKVGGLHAYWALDKAVDVSLAVRLAKLAALAQGSDEAVCDSRRVLRVPGSYNTKYTPAVFVTVRRLEPQLTYDPYELEAYLVAKVLEPVWDGGSRHANAMALGEALGRAGWDEARVEACVRATCELTSDEETYDRVSAAVGTLKRKAAGVAVSGQALREAMGPELYKKFLFALGVLAREGDLTADGVSVGNVATLQRDLVEWTMEDGVWGFAEGAIQRWAGTHWRPSGREELLGSVFTEMARLKVVTSGLEQDYDATYSVATAVARVTEGKLAMAPLPEPSPHLLPVANGLLDLSSGDLLPHDRKAGNPWTLDVAYDPDGTCPTWLQFLDSAVGPEEVRLLQEWLGYLLEAGNSWQRMLWLYGPTGTGKSTFLGVIHDLLGPATGALEAGDLSHYAVASLMGKLVALCSEVSGRVLKTTTLKALVSSDVVTGRHPYGRPFAARFTGKIVWASNALPPVDQGEGLWRRLVLVPFTRKPDVPDEGLALRLRSELSGILNWALEGLVRVRGYKEGGTWAVPGAVEALLKEYKQGADPWAQFAEDCLVMEPGLAIEQAELYAAYRAWCLEQGRRPEEAGPIFRQEMKRVGGEPPDKPIKVGKKTVRAWGGIALKGVTFLAQPEAEE